MDATNDPIKALIEKSGLSCDDLLQKLLQYKTQQKKDIDESKKATSSANDNHVDPTPVISEKTSTPNNSCHPESTADIGDNHNGYLNIGQVDLQQAPQVLEESKPSEPTTEKITSAVEHEKEVPRIDLKNAPCELKENSETSLSTPSTCLENNKESQAIIDESALKEQEEVLDEPLMVEKNSLSTSEDFPNDITNCNDDSSNISCRRKSDELLQKLTNTLNKDGDVDRTERTEENFIEVCQIEDMEVAQPLLKLRSDLFANNSTGHFHTSDNEDEIENNPEIKEFLKNVEEVTGEVKSHPSPKIQNTTEEPVKPNVPRFRRVKMGLVKKRILHKAIKCINDVESRKMEQIKRNGSFYQIEKKNCGNDIPNKDSEEEIRKNLKLQLSSLRNRKKTTNLVDDKNMIDTLKMNYHKHIYGKKKATSKINEVDTSSTVDDQPKSPPPSSEDKAVENINSKIPESEESLFSLSKDTGFMIIDVQGGVEFPEINDGEEKNDQAPSDLIKLTKTKDVTKIKGWQNKKFQLHLEETESDTKEAKQYDISSLSCSKRKIVKGKNENGTKEKLSPFVSNSLEEFLTENSTLNISYNIPKLGAEAGISTQKYNTVIIPPTVEPTTELDKKEESEKEKKPKTLAEKRRMLENSKLKITNKKRAFNKTCYVLYNGHKVFVPASSSNECLESIKFTPKTNTHNETVDKLDDKANTNKKLSLLEMYHQNSTPVSYKPGPLRKKTKLQNEGSTSEWETEIRRLPSIKLNIVPEVGKAVPPHLEHFFKFSRKIREDRLELALSAVLDKSEEKRGFSLTVPYANNQKYVLVRKRKKRPHNVIYEVPPERNTVKSVLDDIISYVENRENEESIIRDAEVYEETDHKKISSSTEISYPKKPKRRKLDSELLRLSCKVVSVSVDETEDKSICQKSFCKLGCVCKSLNCFTRLPMHCSKLDCMFECACSETRNISLDGESGTLSCDTVWRLEDQAKRNLAKVEKEFTQTIIHTNDKTILIPSSDRKKTKRIKRMPKRYSDFLEDFNVEEKVTKEDNLKKMSDCCVRLRKLDVKGIIPLCLFHDCYNCSCLKSLGEKSDPTSDNEAQNKANRKRKHPAIDKKKNESKEGNTSDSDYMEELRIVDSRKFKEKGGCARAFGVHPEVLARNEIPFYKNKLRSKVAHVENSTFIDISTIETIDHTEPITDIIDITTPLQISASDRLKLFLTSKQRKRKKPTSDDPIKSKSESVTGEVNQNKTEEDLPYIPVFNGEIIVPTNENKDFVKKLGVKSAARFMRLLPWDDLLYNYYNHKINIWCPNNNNNKLLMNISDKGPPPGYIEITESRRKNGIMNWILSRELPKNTPSELVHLILSPKDEYFEISGICLKNITEEEKAKKYIEEKTNIETDQISNDSKFFKHKNHANQENVLVMTQKVYYKQDLYIVSPPQPVNNENNFVSVELPSFQSIRWRMVFLNSNFSFLSFIRMNYSIKYTDLKNILKMAQESNKTICLQSRILSQGYCQRNFGIYAVPNFKDNLFIGPYGFDEDHNLQTLRYLRQELVPTEYFEMVQGGVIPNKKKDVWLISKDSQNSSTPLHSSDSEYAVITPLPGSSARSPDSKFKTAQDLQYFHSHVLNGNAQFTTSMDLEEKAFIKFPQFTILNGKKMRPEDYNCCLVTNIPDIGYLGAIKNDETNGIEVDWPFGNKVLRFVNVLCAIQFIKRRFLNLLLPVPASFNLRVILKENVDLMKKISPVDTKSLNGTHICGTFGIMDSRKLSPLLAQSLGTTQEEVLQRLAKRAQFLVRSRLRTLGFFLLPKDEQLAEVLDNVAHLSKLGGLEIDKLKANEKVLIDAKKELIIKKQTNLKKYMDLLMDFPEEQRIREYNKFRQMFNGGSSTKKEINIPSGNPKDAGDIECIEIEDSDSEENTSAEITQATSKVDVSRKKHIVMKSILKPNIVPQISPFTSSDSECRPMENFKLVKSPSGKLVLVKDNSGVSLSKTLSGMKLKIRNNKIIE